MNFKGKAALVTGGGSGIGAMAAQRLAAEAALDGFGCACTPQWVCGTCTARETIAKALAPLMRELGA